MGVSGKQFPSSVEALLRRALKGGGPLRIHFGAEPRTFVVAQAAPAAFWSR